MKAKKRTLFLTSPFWHDVWQALKEQAVKQPRQFGALRHEFEAAGFDIGHVRDALLEPMSEEELSEWYDNPIFPDEATS